MLGCLAACAAEAAKAKAKVHMVRNLFIIG